MKSQGRVDDIALFFSKDGETAMRWVPQDVYADPAMRLGPVDEAWRGAVFTQIAPTEPGVEPVYVANLSNLLDPGQPPADTASTLTGEVVQHRSSSLAEAPKPEAGDLVVIPWADPDHAYLVPKARYESCREIAAEKAADLQFMAMGEGVVLANLPKADIAGMTCYVLNLRAVRAPRRPSK